MVSLVSRLVNNIGQMKTSRLITPALLLTALFLILRWANSPLNQDLSEQNNPHLFQVLDDDQIQQYLHSMSDTRPDSCLYDDYDHYKEKVTILLDFHEHQFYDMKMTLESILHFTPDELIHEIVLLDDGTGSEYIRNDAYAYLQHSKFSKVKAYRSAQSDGPASTRFKASKVASGEVLVFLSSGVTVNKGWLPPLVDIIRSDRHVVAVPHFDSILSGHRFFRTPDNLINIFSWTLQILYLETKQEGRFLNSPVMTGAAFAVDKQFLDDIGNYDEGIGIGGGEDLELSLRAWMCGGSIKIITCSRVALKNALEPQKIANAKTLRRISELWLENYQTLVYKQAITSSDMDESEGMSLKTRKMYLKKHTTCDSFKTYLKDTANELVIPPDDARFFGKLKSKTGYCVVNSDDSLDEVKLQHCKPHMYEADLLLTLDVRGHIKTITDICLDMLSDSDVQFVRCDKKRNQQSWILTSEGLIKNAHNSEFCIYHKVKEASNHYLSLGNCQQDDRYYLWQFIRY